MGIGERIKRMREARNMTQEELGARLDVTKSMVGQIERGTRMLSLPMAKQIAEIFGIGLDDLAR